MMRTITADRILLPDGSLKEGLALVFDGGGAVADVVSASETGDTEHHHGILTPGFINTHCHLELSHLKGIIPRNTGLPGFVRDFVKSRSDEETPATRSAQFADAAMWDAGIQGVGDICNRDHTITVKALSRIRYFNFIEIFGLNSREADKQYRQAVGLCKDFEKHSLTASVTAHAAYSMSPLLLDLIRLHHPLDMPWSVHNQESDDEQHLFSHHKGQFATLFTSMGIDITSLPSDAGSSLKYLLRYIPSTGNLLFVHNTYTSNSDVELMRAMNILHRSWFALCPKANLYIENRLPPIDMLLAAGCQLTIGTDSLASNDALDILSELKAISNHFPQVPAAVLLTWATKNGADFFDWNDLGVFEKGKKPGCILIPTGEQPDDVSQWGKAVRLI